MKPTEEQGFKLWRWCGFREVDGLWRTPVIDFAPSDSRYSFTCPTGLPPIDLNSLFKWAVPKLQDRGHCVTIQSYEQSGYLAFVSETVFSQRGSDGYDPYFKRVSEHEDEAPTLALFWAIWGVIKEEHGG